MARPIRAVRAAVRDLRAGETSAMVERWRFGLRRDALGTVVSRTDPAVRELEARLLALQGSRAGERCFIMGNGPSLNEMDLGLLAGEPVWGVNRCWSLFERLSWRPAFYVSTDHLGLIEAAPTVASMMGELPGTTFFLPVEFRKARFFTASPPNVRWMRHRWQEPTENGGVLSSSFDAIATEGIALTYTVAVTAMQLAVLLGFDPIYLIGCDTSYVVPPGAIRKSESASGMVTYSMPAGVDDPNHFDPTYHPSGARFFGASYLQHVASFRLGRDFAAAHDVTVLNATVGGKLEVFPRVDFEALF